MTTYFLVQAECRIYLRSAKDLSVYRVAVLLRTPLEQEEESGLGESDMGLSRSVRMQGIRGTRTVSVLVSVAPFSVSLLVLYHSYISYLGTSCTFKARTQA